MTTRCSRIVVPRAQRGAAAVFAAITMGASLVALLLAIDVGRLYLAQRELGRAADLAALDAARLAGGCMGAVRDPQAAAYAETVASLQRNGRQNRRRDDREVTLDRVSIGRRVTGEDGRMRFVAAPDAVNRAVQVELSRPLPPRLMPSRAAAADGRRLRAVSAAYSSPFASTHIGATLVDFDPVLLNAYLTQLLGGPVSLSAVGYSALLEAQLPLSEVLDRVLQTQSIQTIEQVVPLRDLLEAMVDALADLGENTASEAAETLARAVDPAREIAPAGLIEVTDEAAGQVGDAVVSAGDLAIAVLRATSEPLIEFAAPLSGPFTRIDVLLRLIDPGLPALLSPNEAGNQVENAQGLLQTVFTVDLDDLGVQLRLPLWVESADASASVSEIFCARAAQPLDRVRVDARASAVRIGIGEFDDLRSLAPQVIPATLIDADLASGALGLPLPVHLRVTASAHAEVPSVDESFVFESPFDEPQTAAGRVRVEEALRRLPATLALRVELQPLRADGTPRPVDAALAPLLDPLLPVVERLVAQRLADALAPADEVLNERLLQMLGLSVSGADVRVYNVTAAEPRLFER